MASAATIVLFCERCNQNCYESIRPLTPGVDAPKPELFRPVGNQNTPPVEGAPPTCDSCGNALAFRQQAGEKARNTPRPDHLSPEELLQAEKNEARALALAQQAERASPVPMAGGVTELFRVDKDEQILNFTPSLDGFVILTNKRVLKVRA